MQKFYIEGGKKLDGSIELESAKNAVLPMLATSVLTDEDVIIKNCPKIQDVLSMVNILTYLGVKAEFIEKDLILNGKEVKSFTLPSSLTGELRASVLMVGALLSRFEKAEIARPGGCEIGVRPIDLHINAFKSLSVNVCCEGENITFFRDKLKGAEIYLNFPSVGATENVMLASVLAEGITVLHNPAKEPEIVDLAKLLNKMGAKIHGAGSSLITIEGVKKLHGAEHKPISDRIELGTYLIAGAITGGKIEIKNASAENIWALLTKISDNTCNITISNDIIYMQSRDIRKGFSVSTGPYPFFPTDMQAQITSLLAVSEGLSIVEENMFEMRFRHIPELVKMGAEIVVRGKNAIIKGVKKLHGLEVTAYDLRCGASLILAGLCAEGKTVVNGIRHVERGYYDIEGKLRLLGAQIYKR